MKKQYIRLQGRPLWIHATHALLDAGISTAWVTVPVEDVDAVVVEAEAEFGEQVHVVAGGASRFESVRNGLKAVLQSGSLAGQSTWVAIHDAARPFVSERDVEHVIAVAQQVGGAILAQPCTDTVKRVSHQRIDATIPRDTLWLAQTPQVFSLEWMERAYFLDKRYDMVTDDASVMELAGYPVQVVSAQDDNRKITTRQDLAFAEWLASQRWGDNQ